MLVDTDVMIWYLKGNEKAYKAIDQGDDFFLSVVTYIELLQGMRNKIELSYLRKFLRNWNVKVIYVSEEISIKAMLYVEQHFLSHSLQLADALIGATAVTYGLPILTANDNHYQVIKGIQIKKFRP